MVTRIIYMYASFTIHSFLISVLPNHGQPERVLSAKQSSKRVANEATHLLEKCERLFWQRLLQEHVVVAFGLIAS